MMGRRVGLWLWLSAALLVADLGAHADAAREPGGVLAYARVTDGYWQIWTYDLGSDTHTQQTDDRFDHRDPSWQPDGGLLLRSHNDELFLQAGGDRSVVPFRRDLWPAFDPASHPSREQVVLAKLRTDLKDASAIWIVGGEKGDQRVLTTGPGLWNHPRWSSDGSRLTYIRSFGYRGSELRVIDVESGAERVLLADGHHNTHPEWSPDDRWIVYASDRSGDYEIYLRDVEREEDRVLTGRPGLDIRPAFSPDGTRIAYTSLVDGRLEIWTVGIDGSGRARLFECDADVSDPAWR